MKSSVKKGFEYEKEVVQMLKDCGFEAYRTNKANPSDPVEYRAGFDGGVDIIAKINVEGNTSKNFVFYIQCKHRKKKLTKTAVCEVYAGMHARGGIGAGNIPVVFATSGASKETRQFARKLGVELILNREMELLNQARTTQNVVYANYGVLMRILLYYYTKNKKLIEFLPEPKANLETLSWEEKVLLKAKVDINRLQSLADVISSQKTELQPNIQEFVDMVKVIILKNIQMLDYFRNNHEERIKSDKTQIDQESG